MIELIHGDCLEKMADIESGSIDTWMTSPPYAKQRDYSGMEAVNYVSWMADIIIEAKRTLKDTGSIFINIKEHCDKGQRDLYVFKMIIHLVEVLDLRYTEEYIWSKTNPFPIGNKKRLKDSYERVLHFTKTKDYKFYPNNVLIKSESKWLKAEKKRKKAPHNVTNGSEMNMSTRVATDMVRPCNVITGTSSNKNIGHPAVYPDYLPEFFIKLTTEENDSVGDMFMGSGTTGVACKNLNRNFIGIELDKDYFEIAEKRIYEPSQENLL